MQQAEPMSLVAERSAGLGLVAHDRAREIIDGLGDGFLSVDADWRFTDCNRATEVLLRRSRDELLGRKLWSIAGLSRRSAFAALGRRVVEGGRAEEAEVALRTGRRSLLLSVRAFPVGGGVGAVWRDIAKARAVERRVAVDQARYRELADGVPAAAWLSRRDGKLIFINQAMADALGRPREELLGDRWMEALDPADRDGLATARLEARTHHTTISYEARFLRPDGSQRIIQLFGRPRFDARGAFCGHVGIASDVTDARVAERRQRVLINELNHRVKNALATVQSLVRQTLREYEAPRQLGQAIDERILALASAHDLLTRRRWQPAEVPDIAQESTRPYSYDGRISFEGPSVKVAPQTAITLSMAMHELATNATKYGALSVAEGKVDVRWRCDAGEVAIEWRERNGPPVAEPQRLGFGSRLLGRVLQGELGHPAELTFAPEGLSCRIRAPVEGAVH